MSQFNLYKKRVSTKHISFFFFLISGITYVSFVWYDKNKDMERHFCNNNKIKYHILIYVKYLLFFIMVYNLKHLAFGSLMQYMNKKTIII